MQEINTLFKTAQVKEEVEQRRGLSMLEKESRERVILATDLNASRKKFAKVKRRDAQVLFN